MMRWSEYLASLPDEEARAVVRTLTLACGHVTWASRMLTEDVPARQVLGHWTAAAAFLQVARRQLVGRTAAAPVDRAARAAPVVPAGASWRATFGQESPFATTLQALLTETVRQVRAVIAAVRADAELDHIRPAVVGALAALAGARQLIAGAS